MSPGRILSVFFGKRNYTGTEPIVDLPEGAREAIDKFKRLIASGGIHFEDVNSLCGARPHQTEAHLLTTRDRYGFPVQTWLSKKSGLGWASPRMTRDSLELFYQGYYQHIYRGKNDPIHLRFAEQIRRTDPVFKLLQSRGLASFDGKTVFDIGCGAGGMLVPFKAAGAKVFGSDLGGADYLNFGRGAGLNLLHGDFEVLKPYGPADLILVSHVLEHLPDPVSFLDRVSALLASGGVIYVEVPGICNLDGYGRDLLRYVQNAHLFHFCAATLATTVKKSGLDLLYVDETCRCLARKRTDPADRGDESSWENPAVATAILRYLGHCKRTRLAVKAGIGLLHFLQGKSRSWQSTGTTFMIP